MFSGSPFADSRTDLLLYYIQSMLEKMGYSVTMISVMNIDPKDLVYAQFDSPHVKGIVNQVENADGVIIGSPVYKATYSGVLKSLLDLLPENAFKGLPVFPFLVGGSLNHLLAIDYSLTMIIRHLKGSPTQGIYFLNELIDKSKPLSPITDAELDWRLQSQIQELLQQIEVRKKANIYIH